LIIDRKARSAAENGENAPVKVDEPGPERAAIRGDGGAQRVAGIG
jgi:hypothetical protein